MRGPKPKPVTSRAGHRRQHLTVIPSTASRPRRPPAPAGIGAEARRHWAKIWSTAVARLWDPDADAQQLERYIRNVDEWLKIRPLVAQSPAVRGLRDTVKLNPLARRVEQLENQLRQAEETLGMTPAGRVRLGIAGATAGRLTVEEMARELDMAEAQWDWSAEAT